ncbi:RNA polymerase sigma24 factor [Chlorella sorokiniana]|uniref:RNA polymerase sigma24 factor n=1 Tax=Chlorella sorokiniana TaxID=3076 RepID=A0A2P6TK30_CHLSO|nr:RNA polymerase sigma24 factor [Chlorella sorokiniana]|eukprot:PRW44439.1 RNA polymerase sigma24 factor [Chlorella sorokiniana]
MAKRSCTGLCALPDDIVRNIQRMKADSERMRLEFERRGYNDPDIHVRIAVDRAMNSPVCTVTCKFREREEGAWSAWQQAQSAVLRAGDQALLEDALLLALSMHNFEDGHTTAELFVGGGSFAQMALEMPEPAPDAALQVVGGFEAESDARLAKALQSAPIRSMRCASSAATPPLSTAVPSQLARANRRPRRRATESTAAMTRPEPAMEHASTAAAQQQAGTAAADDAYVIRCSRKTHIEEWDSRLLGMECTPAQAASLEQRVLAAAQQGDFSLLHEGFCLSTLLPAKGGQLRVVEGLAAANQRAEEVWEEVQRRQEAAVGKDKQLPAANGKACAVLAADGRARWERQQHWAVEASGLRCVACTTLSVEVVQAAVEP